jgi:hypothetical protein
LLLRHNLGPSVTRLLQLLTLLGTKLIFHYFRIIIFI